MDAVMLEVIKNYLISIAEEMGVALKRTSYSPNIKERKDFSCAIFDSEGRMISQAEHLPVHLGSMIFSVQKFLEVLNLEKGDVGILNDPYQGGTHLPDITVISPIYYREKLVGYSANRAHHSDVGGSFPGSMGVCEEIFQEGIVIPPLKLFEKGREKKDILNLILKNVRTPWERKGDLMAQVAAATIGEKRLKELITKYGLKTVLKSEESLLKYSELRTRKEIEKIPDGCYEFEDYMESDGFYEKKFRIHVKIEKLKDEIFFDFSKTSRQAKGPINAVFPVTASCVYYVLRCITDPEIPPNSGMYHPVKIKVPEGSLLNPTHPKPVAGGNVETSQRIVDVLIGALSTAIPEKVIAACCGTMTNISFGGEYNGKPFTYYETVGGGFGARPCKDGIDAIHTHMTNTQNTPIEALEIEFPVQVTEYGIRYGSSGKGKFRGGNGIVRKIKFLNNAKLSILSERTRVPPYGLFGGENGRCGRIYVIRGNRKIVLKSKCSFELKENDVLCIETPGGGGYGKGD